MANAIFERIKRHAKEWWYLLKELERQQQQQQQNSFILRSYLFNLKFKYSKFHIFIEDIHSNANVSS